MKRNAAILAAVGAAALSLRWARRIAPGDWLGGGVSYQAPLYPYVLAAIYRVFGESVTTIRLVQAAIGTGSCVLLAAAAMWLFRRARRDRRSAARALSHRDLPRRAAREMCARDVFTVTLLARTGRPQEAQLRSIERPWTGGPMMVRRDSTWASRSWRLATPMRRRAN